MRRRKECSNIKVFINIIIIEQLLKILESNFITLDLINSGEASYRDVIIIHLTFNYKPGKCWNFQIINQRYTRVTLGIGQSPL